MTSPTIPSQSTRALAAEVAAQRSDIEALKASLRAAQLGNSSIDNGALVAKDSTGAVRAVVGLQPDGTFTTTSVNNPVAPPVPAVPTVLPTKAGIQVGSNGPSVGVWPMDFAGIRVYTAAVGAPGVLAGTITPDPGVLPVAPLPYVPQRAWLTSINHSGVESAPSPEVVATPAMVVTQDVLDGIVTTVKLADQAVAQAKIALQGVGTGQIQGKAVTLANLADGSVDARTLVDGSVTPAKITFTARDIGSIANFYQATAPTGARLGDLWVDTSTSANQLKQWNGTAWVVVQDASAALAAAQTAQTNAASALNAANSAQATADGKVTVFYTSTTPVGAKLGDLWLNTAAGNKLNRYSGTAWVVVDDAQLATALANASTAQSTADGKIDAFYQGTAPVSGMSVGDLWYNTANGNLASRWNGAAWVALPVGTGALSSGAVTVPIIANGAVTGPAIAASAVNTTQIAAGAVTANTIAANTITASQIAADTITANQIAAAAIGATELAANSVVAGKIAADSVTSTNIVALSIQAGNLAADSVQAGKIAASAVTSREIQALTIVAGDIAANTITAGQIAAGSITADRLAATLVLASTLIAGSPGGARVQLTGSGIQAFRPDGVMKTLDFSTVTGNIVVAGQYRSGDSGERIMIDVDGTQTFTNSGGGTSGKIANNGNDLLLSGTQNGSGQSGVFNTNAAGAGITFRVPGSATLYGEMNLQKQRLAVTSPQVDLRADTQYAAIGGGASKVRFVTLDGNGNEIGGSSLYYRDYAGTACLLAPGQDSGIKFELSAVLSVNAAGTAFQSHKALSFVTTSGKQAKRNVKDLPTALGKRSIDVARAARPKQYDYDDQHNPPRPASPDGMVRQKVVDAAGVPMLDHYGYQQTRDVEMQWAGPERPRRKHVGLIAEDVKAVAPSMVIMSSGPDGVDEVSLDIGGLAALAVGAAADVSDDLALLAARVAVLESAVPKPPMGP